MKTFFERFRSLFAALGAKIKRKPKAAPAVREPSTQPRPQDVKAEKRKWDRFTIVSWVVTAVIVASLLTSALLYKSANATSTALPTPQPTSVSDIPVIGAPVLNPAGGGGGSFAISRKLQLKTNIPERPRYTLMIYRVSRGDSMWGIADKFKLKSESILFANPQMDDNPHNLKPGMELKIPPMDGMYYEWKDGDTFESVADKFGANTDDIIDFPGNKIDLTNPKIDPGATVMIPGGMRELRNWAADLPTGTRSNTGSTGTSDFGNNATCGGGAVASGFGWPADDHNLSGNPYGPGHLGIDISAPEGSNVYAAGSGVVTMAQGGWNYGYGNVVQIDHGNGYVTVYAHLSSINVSTCQSVGQGTLIGLSGNTGNSFGAHLHFEIRIGGQNVNPYDIVQ
jgi:murein DD-endopeptidase MepM/ murein hydrolase activator NlpD